MAAEGNSKKKKDGDENQEKKEKKAVTASQARRRRRQGGKSEKKLPSRMDASLKAMLLAVMKLSLMAHRDALDAKAVLFTNLLVSAVLPPIKEAIAELKSYTAAARQNPTGHGMGSPGLCMFLTFVEELCLENVGAKNQKELTGWVETNGDRNPKELEHIIRHFRLIRTYKEERMRMEMVIAEQSLHDTLVSSIGPSTKP